VVFVWRTAEVVCQVLIEGNLKIREYLENYGEIRLKPLLVCWRRLDRMGARLAKKQIGKLVASDLVGARESRSRLPNLRYVHQDLPAATTLG
jgi:hypothetical protein